MALYIERIADGDGESQGRLIVRPGLQRLKVSVGDRFRLVDDSGATPASVVVKRLDNHLLIEGLPDEARIELTDFYARCGLSSPCTVELNPAGEEVLISPASEPLQALTDGSYVIWPAGLAPAAPSVAGEIDAGDAGLSWSVGGALLAGLVVAAAGGAGGGGGESGPVAVSPGPPAAAPPPAAPDLAAPARPVVTSEKAFASTKPVVAGLAEPGATVTVSFDTDGDGGAEAVYATTADAAGNWRVDLATATATRGALGPGGLPDNATTRVTVVAADASANVSEPQSFELFVDATAPGAPRIVAIVDDVPGRVGTVANGGTTNDTTPTLQGTLAARLGEGEHLDILRDGERIATIASLTGTSWSYTDAGLALGDAPVYQVRVVDALGNESAPSAGYRIVLQSAASKTAAITAIDDDVPARLGAIGDGGATNDRTPTIVGRLSEALAPGESLQVLRNGQATTLRASVSGTAFSVTDSALADGSYTYAVRVVDAEGAGATSAGYRIAIDTVNAKTATIASITDSVLPTVGVVRDGGTTNDTTPTLSGRLSGALAAGETLEVLRDGAVVRTLTTSDVRGVDWTFTDAGLAGGERYDYTVRVVDAAGNLGRASAGYEIRVEASAKSVDSADAGRAASVVLGAEDLFGVGEPDPAAASDAIAVAPAASALDALLLPPPYA